MRTAVARTTAGFGVDRESAMVLAFGWFVAFFVTLT